jgi:hypothetical protein
VLSSEVLLDEGAVVLCRIGTLNLASAVLSLEGLLDEGAVVLVDGGMDASGR